MSLDQRLALWIDPASDPTVTLTMEQKGSMVILANTRLLPVCLPEAAPADGGNVQLDYCWYPGDSDTVRVTMAPSGDLVSVEYQHTPCDGDGTPGEWKLDTGDMWASLKAAILQD
ncbi:MAG TPA: hypothetical protein VF885_20015 [Arthrobacter sp.]